MCYHNRLVAEGSEVLGCGSPCFCCYAAGAPVSEAKQEASTVL